MLASDCQSPSILITDDDDSVRQVLDEVFQGKGFHTLLAADGQEALEIVRGDTVHVVVADMHMPRLTGLELIQSIGQFNAALPCILMSAAADEQLLKQARLARAHSVLAKPVTRHQITRSVARALMAAYDWHFTS